MSAEHTKWAADMEVFHDKAAGVVGIDTVVAGDLPELLMRIVEGDPHAAVLLRTVTETLHRVETAPRRRPMLCGCCPRPLKGDGFSVCVVRPEEDAPTGHALTFAICSSCGTTAETVRAAAVTAMRRIWPDTRQITVHPDRGRA